MLFEEYAKKFQKIHKERTAEELSDEEALENFKKLVEMVRRVYKPIPKDDFERIDINQDIT